MRTMRVSEARDNLYKLVDDAAQTHEPIMITGKRSNAVIIGEDEWRAVEETLYLLSVPGMRESIVKGMKTPIEKCTKTLKW
jgi:prevent-host-death family protein